MEHRAAETLGIYVSIPFCKAKCSFCNFASGVFADGKMPRYVDRVCEEMLECGSWAAGLAAEVPCEVDTVYLGGGTPSLLPPELVRRLFCGIRSEFRVTESAEITVECAPGQMSDDTLEAFQCEGVNRLSFGVQSFVDRESAAVGRLHTAEECRRELARMRSAGVERLALDLIVGLPHQTRETWEWSVKEAIASGVEHVSVYMLEVDEDSRLGREALLGGHRFGAGLLPREEAVADWYEMGCEWLNEAGLRQYEISNFATEGAQSRHNRKYWERKPYVGFGLDAHSMLRCESGAVRWANTDEMNAYLATKEGLGFDRAVDRVDASQALEEALFLGLRLVEGVDLSVLREEFGRTVVERLQEAFCDTEDAGLLAREGAWLRLTDAGRLASNEVFERLLAEPVA